MMTALRLLPLLPLLPLVFEGLSTVPLIPVMPYWFRKDWANTLPDCAAAMKLFMALVASAPLVPAGSVTSSWAVTPLEACSRDRREVTPDVSCVIAACVWVALNFRVMTR